MNPYKIAKDGLCQYSGDANPLDHDGFWYDPSTWESDGYANVLRVTCMPEGPSDGKLICVEWLVALKKDHAEMAKSFECCGIDDDTQRNNVNCQIECAISYGFYDPQDNPYESNSRMFIVPDDVASEEINEYAKIHGATITTEAALEEIISLAVSRDSCNP